LVRRNVVKKFFALVAVGLLILGAASCDTKNIGNLPTGNVAPSITSATYVEATGILTVAINEPNAADIVTVTCSVPTGLHVDQASKTFSKTGNVTFTWTATDAAAGGSGTTTVTANDGSQTDTETVAINVLPVTNSAPVIVSHAYVPATGILTVVVSDVDNDPVTVAVSAVAGLTANPATAQPVATGNGSVTVAWTGAVGTSGDTTITINDGHNPDVTATQTINIPAPNTAPTITATYAAPLLSVVITDPDDATVSVSLSAIAGLSFAPASPQTVTMTAGTGSIDFTYTADVPANGGNGTVTITANDGTNPDVTATQAVSIGPVGPNTAPVIGTVTYVDPTLTVNVTDAEGGLITVAVTSPGTAPVPDQLSKTFTGASGSVAFTWTGAGTYDTTITVTDSGALTDTATQTITVAAPNAAPVIGAVTFTNGVLTVPVTDDGATVDVSVTTPAGFSAPTETLPVTVTVPGNAVFHFSATDIFGGATGDTDITVTDLGGLTDTATQSMVLTGLPVAADTLYAYPLASTAAVGDPVTVLVYTGTPANALQFLSSVGFTVETAGTYVAGSFNNGAPGGARMDTDGYWGLLGAGTPPANGQYLDLGDSLMPGPATAIAGGLQRYNFAVVTQGAFAAPATLPGGGAILYSFQLTFSAAGTYHLGFQLNDGAFDQTYYSDQNGTNFFWGTLDGSNTITVN
jgi:hypothetical protein